MKVMKYRFLSTLILLCVTHLYGQDPHYTQFTAAPFTVNPAYAGVFNGTARIMSNYRQQWANLVDPFTTAVIAGDVKVGAYDPENGQHPFNIGVQLMQDNSMAGAFRSSYAGLMAAYHVKLDESNNQSLGAGLSVNYGNRRIDFASLSFDRQFTSGGFNLQFPSGEAALQNMKPFVSVGAGLLFRSSNPLSGTFFDVGISGYHFNRPIQTVMADPNQVLPIRVSAQFSFQQYLNDISILNINGLYQKQAETSYLLAGFSLARLIGSSNQNMIGGGLWYRSAESFAPHAYIEINGMRIGLSHDIAYNNLKRFLTPASSFEISFQWRLGELTENILR
ncbi:MAG: PorP/SprF family type IX secretion system membrane protein [Sphingomonadales bacterium]|jgi:type IX secretion system PorP/SprF family membrane protein